MQVFEGFVRKKTSLEARRKQNREGVDILYPL
jgi:hypothetical protein